MKLLFKIKNNLSQKDQMRRYLYEAKLAAMKTNPKIYKTVRFGSFPKGIFIQTQSRCNARCIVCPHADQNYRQNIPHGRMSDPLFTKIIDECSQYKIKEICPEFLNEPLMDSALENRIEYIRKKCPSTYISLMTNGSFLNKERAKKLALSGLDRILFSVHGIHGETYMKNMGGLDLHKTLEGINYFLSENGKVKVQVAIMKNLLSESELQEAKDYWKTRGVSISIQRSNDRTGTVSDNAHVVWKPESTNKIVGCIFDYPLRYMPIHFNGDVVLCCYDWNREVLLGNLNESSIYDIWNSKKYSEIRRTIYGNCPPGFICDRCVIAARLKERAAYPPPV